MDLHNTPSWGARFWAKVDKSGECWVWRAGRNRGGYGIFHLPNPYRQVLAHRVSYELNIGPIPDGLLICHHCDNRACVRPDHLFVGTHQDNTRDMHQKGRGYSGDVHWTRAHPERRFYGDQNPARLHPEKMVRGSQHYRTRLTEEMVREIRERYAAGGVTYQQLADQYDQSCGTIQKIVRRTTWRHVI